jgi:hypothetical protein
MAGPAIRDWGFARILGSYFSATLAIPPFVKQVTPPAAPSPARIKVCSHAGELTSLAQKADVIVTVGSVLSAQPSLLNTQLRVADFMICASEKQRDYWLRLLVYVLLIVVFFWRLTKLIVG